MRSAARPLLNSLRGFIGGGDDGFVDRGQQAIHGFGDAGVGTKPVGHIDESDIEGEGGSVGRLKRATVKSICLTNASAHGDAVDGSAKTLFRDRHKYFDRSVGGKPVIIDDPDSAKGKRNSAADIFCGEKSVDVSETAKLMALVERETLHYLAEEPFSDPLFSLR